MISEFNSSTFFFGILKIAIFLCFHRFGMFLNILNIHVMHIYIIYIYSYILIVEFNIMLLSLLGTTSTRQENRMIDTFDPSSNRSEYDRGPGDLKAKKHGPFKLVVIHKPLISIDYKYVTNCKPSYNQVKKKKYIHTH